MMSSGLIYDFPLLLCQGATREPQHQDAAERGWSVLRSGTTALNRIVRLTILRVHGSTLVCGIASFSLLLLAIVPHPCPFSRYS